MEEDVNEMTFIKAFTSKESKLTDKLDVSHGLLLKLKDRGILSERQFDDIQLIQGEHAKVEKLLAILKRADDSKFDVFCEVLCQNEQSHIVDMLCPEPGKLYAELCEIIEPAYDLPFELRTANIISNKQFEIMRSEKYNPHYCVAYMLRTIMCKVKTLTEPSFLAALTRCSQQHVVNFITEDGNMGPEFGRKFGDVRPLNEQQRRRLTMWTLLEELDSRNAQLQELLVKESVISRIQREDIVTMRTLADSNEQLLRIMQRRSLQDVNKFIEYLEETGQNEVVKHLVVAGVFVCIHTKNANPEHKQHDRTVIKNTHERHHLDHRQSDQNTNLEERGQKKYVETRCGGSSTINPNTNVCQHDEQGDRCRRRPFPVPDPSPNRIEGPRTPILILRSESDASPSSSSPDTEADIIRQTTGMFGTFVVEMDTRTAASLYPQGAEDNMMTTGGAGSPEVMAIEDSVASVFTINGLLLSTTDELMTPEMRVGRHLATIAADVNARYSNEFRKIVRQLHIDESTAYETFSAVARQLFSDGIVNWGRIIVFLCFGYRVVIAAVRVCRTLLTKFFSFVVEFIVREKIASWVAGRGGWVAVLRYIPESIGLRTIGVIFGVATVCIAAAIYLKHK